MLYLAMIFFSVLISFSSRANQAHELASKGRWAEVGHLIRSGKYDVDEIDSQGNTLSDIALNRGELGDFETYCFSHEYETREASFAHEETTEAMPPLQIEPNDNASVQPEGGHFRSWLRSFCCFN